MTLIVGHSWVRRLAEFYFEECEGFEFIGKGGATFSSIISEVERHFSNPRRPRPQRVFVFLGSNDLDAIPSTARVTEVTRDCQALCSVLRRLCPGAKLIFSQVEDRFYRNHCEDEEALRQDFKAKSNKFNKWINKWKGKDHLFILKGRVGFSDPKLFSRDGVHLNFVGNKKLAQRIADFAM